MSTKNPSKFQIAEKYRGLQENVWVKFASPPTKEKAVNLGQGFPDYTTAPEVLATLAEVSKPDSNYLNHQYTRAFGHVPLVEALGKLYGKFVGREFNPLTEILVTGGAYGALFCSIMGNVNSGDEVIILEPAFDCYESMVKLAGGTPVFVPIMPMSDTSEVSIAYSSDWKFDVAKLTEAFNSKTKAIIINTPNNPLGKVLTKEELLIIGKLAEKHDTLIISDEVYEWIVYEGSEHVRICSLENFWQRTLTVGSAGKAFSLTGWKLGWVYGPEDIIRNLQVVLQNCTYMCQTPEQEALAITFEKEIPLLGTPQSYFQRITKDLTVKRARMVNAIVKTGCTPVVPEGGYFIMVDWTKLSKKIDLSNEEATEGEGDGFRFVNWLNHHKRIIAIPPSAFYCKEHREYGEKYVRFNFFKKDETLDEAEKIFSTF